MTVTCDALPRTEPSPEVNLKRVPVTQELMAVLVGKEIRKDELSRKLKEPKAKKGDTPGTLQKRIVSWEKELAELSSHEAVSHPAQEHFAEALFSSIHDMVYKLAEKYKTTCHEEADDLAQACFSRLVKVIHKYDPKLAKFSTWSWRVCLSVLNRKYRRNIKQMQDMVRPYDGFDAADVSCEDTVFTIDFADALRDLKVAYPDRVVLIHEIFGNPDDGGFVTGAAAGMKIAAEKAGMEYSQAYYFYSKVVKPFMRRRLEGYSEGGDDE